LLAITTLLAFKDYGEPRRDDARRGAFVGANYAAIIGRTESPLFGRSLLPAAERVTLNERCWLAATRCRKKKKKKKEEKKKKT